MKSSGRSMKFTYIFATAIAVAIISLGSLINFHQYKIWGKPLIPEFVGIKRDVHKSDKSFFFSKVEKGNSSLQKYAHPVDMVSPALCAHYTFCGTPLYRTTPFQPFSPGLTMGSHSLRAPPAV